MRHPLLLFLSTLLLYSCQNNEVEKVDFQDIKAICDDLDFQFSSTSIYDSIQLFSQDLILLSDSSECYTVIKKKPNLINSDLKEEMLSIDNQKNIEKDRSNEIYLIN